MDQVWLVESSQHCRDGRGHASGHYRFRAVKCWDSGNGFDTTNTDRKYIGIINNHKIPPSYQEHRIIIGHLGTRWNSLEQPEAI